MNFKFFFILLIICLPSYGKTKNIIIRITNKDLQSIPILVVPIHGNFTYPGDMTIVAENKNFFINVNPKMKTMIYATPTYKGFRKVAEGEVYIGGTKQLDSCYFHLLVTLDPKGDYDKVACDKNFVMLPCFKKYLINFNYISNIMDIEVYNKNTTEYVNDGACNLGLGASKMQL